MGPVASAEGERLETSITMGEAPQRWEKGTRYYEARLHRNLWGDWLLSVRWGRRRTRLGQSRDRTCASYAEGLARLAAVAMQRAQRGYQPVGHRAQFTPGI